MGITLELPSGQRVAVEASTILVGRDPACNVALPDEDRIRPRHATIKRVANRWMIQSEGDWLLQVGSGVPGGKCWLNPDDVIRLTEAGPNIVFMPTVEQDQNRRHASFDTPAPAGRPANMRASQATDPHERSWSSDPSPLSSGHAANMPKASGEDLTQEWFYSFGNQKKGPVTAEELKTLVTTGQLQATDLVWMEGMKEWVEARKVKGLCPAAPATSAQFPPPIPAAIPAIPPIPAPGPTTLDSSSLGNATATPAATAPPRKYAVNYTSFFGINANDVFTGKGEFLASGNNLTFTGQAWHWFSSKTLNILCQDVEGVAVNGNKISFSYRTNGKIKRFAFFAAKGEVGEILALIPQTVTRSIAASMPSAQKQAASLTSAQMKGIGVVLFALFCVTMFLVNTLSPTSYVAAPTQEAPKRPEEDPLADEAVQNLHSSGKWSPGAEENIRRLYKSLRDHDKTN